MYMPQAFRCLIDMQARGIPLKNIDVNVAPVQNPNNLTIRQFLGSRLSNPMDKSVMAFTIIYQMSVGGFFAGWAW